MKRGIDSLVEASANLLLLSWTVWITAAVIFNLVKPWQSYLPVVLSDMLTYGKLKDDSLLPSPVDSSSPISRFLSYFLLMMNSMPRRYFVHFYMWGCVWNLLLLLSLKHHIPGVGVLVHFLTGTPTPVLKEDGQQWSPQTTDVFLALTLLFIQTSRRLLECLFVIEHSDRKMHVVHYVMGLYFYTATGPTAMLHLNSSDGMLTATSFLQWSHVAAAVLFTWASYHQYTCHVILANLRRRTQTTKQHIGGKMTNRGHVQPNANLQSVYEQSIQKSSLGIPVGDWFHLVSCPHYFAEVLIYCSVVLMERGSIAMMFPCVFVITVLTLSARQMHSWYCHKFDDYPRNRKIIFPFLF